MNKSAFDGTKQTPPEYKCTSASTGRADMARSLYLVYFATDQLNDPLPVSVRQTLDFCFGIAGKRS